MVVKRCVLWKDSDRGSKKRRVEEEEEEEDRITGLPDEILAQILCRLTLKEATATSILSRQWKYQWTSISSSKLSFDCGKALCDKAFEEPTFDIYRYRAKFVGWVNYVLKVLEMQQQDSFKVDSFRVCCSLGASYSSNLDKWVKFVFEKRVREFELNLTDFNASSQHFPYAFPNVAELYKLGPSLNITSLTSLTSLRLMNLDVSSEVVEHFMLRCVSLEHLCVVRSRTLDNLMIMSDNLKTLELYQCKPMDRFEILAPNLVSLLYTGPETEIPFKKENVPLLSELVLGDEYCEDFIFEAPKHSVYFSQLEKLTLVLPQSASEEDIFPDDLPKMMNLKQLELRIGISRGYPLDKLLSFIEAAPSLTKFVMKLVYVDIIPDYIYQSVKYLRVNSDHENLKEIEFVGFSGHKCDFDFVLHMLELCICLKKITIDTRHPGYMWGPYDFCEAFATPDPEDRQAAVERAGDLRSQLPSGSEIFIL